MMPILTISIPTTNVMDALLLTPQYPFPSLLLAVYLVRANGHVGEGVGVLQQGMGQAGMQHATSSSMHYATHSMQHATCNMHLVQEWVKQAE